MSPEEVIGKFVSFELMIKDSKHIVNLEQGATSTPEVQPVAFKPMEEEKKEPTPSRLPINASKLDNEEMALIIKSFRQILKQRRGRTTNPVPRKCVTVVEVTGTKTRKGRRRRKKDTTKRRAAMRTYVGNGTPTRAPLTPPPTMTPPTSPSTNASSSPTLATNVSWLRTTKGRRYTLEPPLNIQHLVMRVALVIVKITCSFCQP
jgi:hypothetical protein